MTLIQIKGWKTTAVEQTCSWLLFNWAESKVTAHFLDQKSKQGHLQTSASSDEKHNPWISRASKQFTVKILDSRPNFSVNAVDWQTLWCLPNASHFVFSLLYQSPSKKNKQKQNLLKVLEQLKEMPHLSDSDRLQRLKWLSEREVLSYLWPFMDIRFWVWSQCGLCASIPIAAGCQLTSLSLMITDLNIIRRWTPSLSSSIFLSFYALIFQPRSWAQLVLNSQNDFSVLPLFSVHSLDSRRKSTMVQIMKIMQENN